MIALTSQLRAQVPAPWRRALLPFAGLLVAIVVLYLPTVQAMVAVWSRSETFAHAFVVPPIVLWLVWRKRFELRRLAPQPQPWMLLALAAMAVLWMLGDLAAANVVTQFAFTAMLVLSVPAVLGRQVTQVILFPLVFLFYAVPAGESLTPIMMQWTADFTVKALRVSGIPVYREGLQFVIPSGSWSVVEACSGIRYLIASFMVGSLFAYLNYRSFRRQLAFVAVSIVLPLTFFRCAHQSSVDGRKRPGTARRRGLTLRGNAVVAASRATTAPRATTRPAFAQRPPENASVPRSTIGTRRRLLARSRAPLWPLKTTTRCVLLPPQAGP